MRHQKFILQNRELPTVVLSYNVKILTSGVVFTVKKYRTFIKNKKIITFCGCKPSQKTTLSLIKILLAPKKSVELLDELQDTYNIKTER